MKEKSIWFKGKGEREGEGGGERGKGELGESFLFDLSVLSAHNFSLLGA